LFPLARHLIYLRDSTPNSAALAGAPRPGEAT
jgi:hypothetical protein